MGQQIECMRAGLARGMSLPREVLGAGFERSIAVYVVDDPAASVFLPDGRAFYRQQVRHCTTLDLPGEQIHALGLAEVARITAEMTAVVRQTGFQGSLAEFLHFLRTDPRFYAKTPGELLRRAALIAKTIDGKLPSLVRTLPRIPHTVAPVPDSIAPNYTAGRYVEPQAGSTQRCWAGLPRDGHRAGGSGPALPPLREREWTCDG